MTVCVTLLSPTGVIGDTKLLLEVNNGITLGSPAASKLLLINH